MRRSKNMLLVLSAILMAIASVSFSTVSDSANNGKKTPTVTVAAAQAQGGNTTQANVLSANVSGQHNSVKQTATNVAVGNGNASALAQATAPKTTLTHKSAPTTVAAAQARGGDTTQVNLLSADVYGKGNKVNQTATNVAVVDSNTLAAASASGLNKSNGPSLTVAEASAKGGDTTQANYLDASIRGRNNHVQQDATNFAADNGNALALASASQPANRLLHLPDTYGGDKSHDQDKKDHGSQYGNYGHDRGHSKGSSVCNAVANAYGGSVNQSNSASADVSGKHGRVSQNGSNSVSDSGNATAIAEACNTTITNVTNVSYVTYSYVTQQAPVQYIVAHVCRYVGNMSEYGETVAYATNVIEYSNEYSSYGGKTGYSYTGFMQSPNKANTVGVFTPTNLATGGLLLLVIVVVAGAVAYQRRHQAAA